MSEPTIAELSRELAASERRYADLAAHVIESGSERGREIIARHARVVAMSDWHAKFFNLPTSTIEPQSK